MSKAPGLEVTPPLIEFELRPLDTIQPWGAPQDPSLHWFGLSDGVWWLNAGDQRLFEYSSPAVREFWESRYCDYQVARLHEDLIELLPYALEEVPVELKACIALEGRKSWSARWERWMTSFPDHDFSAADFELIDLAGSWLGRRALDSAYLTPSFDLRIWSSQGQTHLEWDNRAKLVEGGACAWTAVVGSHALPVAEFASGVRDFHERFIRGMAGRVEEVWRCTDRPWHSCGF